MERVSANTPGEEIKTTKTVDAATSTTIDREEETKREDGNDDQEIVEISDDDENDDDENDDDENDGNDDGDMVATNLRRTN